MTDNSNFRDHLLFKIDEDLSCELQILAELLAVKDVKELISENSRIFDDRIARIQDLFDKASVIIPTIKTVKIDVEAVALQEAKERIDASFGLFQKLQNLYKKLWDKGSREADEPVLTRPEEVSDNSQEAEAAEAEEVLSEEELLEQELLELEAQLQAEIEAAALEAAEKADKSKKEVARQQRLADERAAREAASREHQAKLAYQRAEEQLRRAEEERVALAQKQQQDENARRVKEEQQRLEQMRLQAETAQREADRAAQKAADAQAKIDQRAQDMTNQLRQEISEFERLDAARFQGMQVHSDGMRVSDADLRNNQLREEALRLERDLRELSNRENADRALASYLKKVHDCEVYQSFGHGHIDFSNARIAAEMHAPAVPDFVPVFEDPSTQRKVEQLQRTLEETRCRQLYDSIQKHEQELDHYVSNAHASSYFSEYLTQYRASDFHKTYFSEPETPKNTVNTPPKEANIIYSYGVGGNYTATPYSYDGQFDNQLRSNAAIAAALSQAADNNASGQPLEVSSFYQTCLQLNLESARENYLASRGTESFESAKTYYEEQVKIFQDFQAHVNSGRYTVQDGSFGSSTGRQNSGQFNSSDIYGRRTSENVQPQDNGAVISSYSIGGSISSATLNKNSADFSGTYTSNLNLKGSAPGVVAAAYSRENPLLVTPEYKQALRDNAYKAMYGANLIIDLSGQSRAPAAGHNVTVSPEKNSVRVPFGSEKFKPGYQSQTKIASVLASESAANGTINGSNNPRSTLFAVNRAADKDLRIAVDAWKGFQLWEKEGKVVVSPDAPVSKPDFIQWQQRRQNYYAQTEGYSIKNSKADPTQRAAGRGTPSSAADRDNSNASSLKDKSSHILGKGSRIAHAAVFNKYTKVVAHYGMRFSEEATVFVGRHLYNMVQIEDQGTSVNVLAGAEKARRFADTTFRVAYSVTHVRTLSNRNAEQLGNKLIDRNFGEFKFGIMKRDDLTRDIHSARNSLAKNKARIKELEARGSALSSAERVELLQLKKQHDLGNRDLRAKYGERLKLQTDLEKRGLTAKKQELFYAQVKENEIRTQLYSEMLAERKHGHFSRNQIAEKKKALDSAFDERLGRVKHFDKVTKDISSQVQSLKTEIEKIQKGAQGRDLSKVELAKIEELKGQIKGLTEKKIAHLKSIKMEDLKNQITTLNSSIQTMQKEITTLRKKGSLSALEKKHLETLKKKLRVLNRDLAMKQGLLNLKDNHEIKKRLLDEFAHKRGRTIGGFVAGFSALRNAIFKPLREGTETSTMGYVYTWEFMANRHVHKIVKRGVKLSLWGSRKILMLAEGTAKLAIKSGVYFAKGDPAKVDAAFSKIKAAPNKLVKKTTAGIKTQLGKGGRMIKTTARNGAQRLYSATPTRIKTAVEKTGAFGRKVSKKFNSLRVFQQRMKEEIKRRFLESKVGRMVSGVFRMFGKAGHGIKIAAGFIKKLLIKLVAGYAAIMLVFCIGSAAASSIASLATSVIFGPDETADGKIDLTSYVTFLNEEQTEFDKKMEELCKNAENKEYGDSFIKYHNGTCMNNTKEILSMAAVYLGQDFEDKRVVEDYIGKLFEDSHSYTTRYGPTEYCPNPEPSSCNHCEKVIDQAAYDEIVEKEVTTTNEDGEKVTTTVEEIIHHPEVSHYECRGHRDFYVEVTVLGFDEIFDADTKGNSGTSVGQGDKLGNFTLTAYCACETCCGIYSGGPTASGAMPKANKTIAVDTSVIKMGTHVIINGQEYVAQDTGSAIIGNRIDIYFDSHEAALAFGRKDNVPVYKVSYSKTPAAGEEWEGWSEDNKEWCKNIYNQDWNELYGGVDTLFGSLGNFDWSTFEYDANSPLTQAQQRVTNVAQHSSSYGIPAIYGYCQQWVRLVYTEAGFSGGSAASAVEAGKKWGVSSDWSQVPAGAAVYGYSNSQYGHVGIVVVESGVPLVYHNIGRVAVDTLEDWVQKYKGFAWGWQGGYDLTTRN